MFTFWGTGATLYGIKLCLEISLAGFMEHEICEDAVGFVTDSCSHMDNGEAIVAFKSFILWDFVDENHIDAVFDKGLGARKLLMLS